MKFEFEKEYKNYPFNSEICYSFNMSEFPEAHDHDYWEILIICEGSYSHLLNGKKYIIKRGDGLFIRPNDNHSLKGIGNKFAHVNITVTTNAMKQACDNLSPNMYELILNKKDVVAFSVNPIQLTDIEEYGNTLVNGVLDEKNYRFISKLLLSKLINMLVDDNYHISSNKPDWINNLTKAVREVRNLDWKVDDVCNYVKFSRAHVNRCFQKYYQCSIGDYLGQVKLSAAVDFLKHTEKPVGEIATILGFSSVSHLNHIFKEKYECSPLEFRRNSKENN